MSSGDNLRIMCFLFSFFSGLFLSHVIFVRCVFTVDPLSGYILYYISLVPMVSTLMNALIMSQDLSSRYETEIQFSQLIRIRWSDIQRDTHTHSLKIDLFRNKKTWFKLNVFDWVWIGPSICMYTTLNLSSTTKKEETKAHATRADQVKLRNHYEMRASVSYKKREVVIDKSTGLLGLIHACQYRLSTTISPNALCHCANRTEYACERANKRHYSLSLDC